MDAGEFETEDDGLCLGATAAAASAAQPRKGKGKRGLQDQLAEEAFRMISDANADMASLAKRKCAACFLFKVKFDFSPDASKCKTCRSDEVVLVRLAMRDGGQPAVDKLMEIKAKKPKEWQTFLVIWLRPSHGPCVATGGRPPKEWYHS